MARRLDGGLASYARMVRTTERRSTLSGMFASKRRLPQRFVIVTAGRSGSELLVHLLGRHPDIRCDSEVLRDPVAFPNAVINGRAVMARRAGKKAYGFKLQPRQAFELQWLHPVTWLPELHADGWTLVHLRRRNMLHQVISAIRGSRTGFHHTADRAPAFEALTIDPADVLTGLSLLEESVGATERSLRDVPSIELVYEDDLATEDDQRRTVEMLCAQLGLAMQWSPSDLIKVQPTATRAMVANYDEIAAAVAATRFASYLAD